MCRMDWLRHRLGLGDGLGGCTAARAVRKRGTTAVSTGEARESYLIV